MLFAKFNNPMRCLVFIGMVFSNISREVLLLPLSRLPPDWLASQSGSPFLEGRCDPRPRPSGSVKIGVLCLECMIPVPRKAFPGRQRLRQPWQRRALSPWNLPFYISYLLGNLPLSAVQSANTQEGTTPRGFLLKDFHSLRTSIPAY